MFTRLQVVLTFPLLLVVSVGCSSTAGTSGEPADPKAAEVLSSHWNALKRGDWQLAYDQLHPDLKVSGLTLRQFTGPGSTPADLRRRAFPRSSRPRRPSYGAKTSLSPSTCFPLLQMVEILCRSHPDARLFSESRAILGAWLPTISSGSCHHELIFDWLSIRRNANAMRIRFRRGGKTTIHSTFGEERDIRPRTTTDPSRQLEGSSLLVMSTERLFDSGTRDVHRIPLPLQTRVDIRSTAPLRAWPETWTCTLSPGGN